MNRTTLMGNIGKDIELRYTKSGKAVANCSMATTVTAKNGTKYTTWHQLTFWGDRAVEAAENYRKGDLVKVEGSNQNQSWTDRDGVKRFTAFVNVGKIELIWRKGMVTKKQQQAALANEDPVF